MNIDDRLRKAHKERLAREVSNFDTGKVDPLVARGREDLGPPATTRAGTRILAIAAAMLLLCVGSAIVVTNWVRSDESTNIGVAVQPDTPALQDDPTAGGQGARGDRTLAGPDDADTDGRAIALPTATPTSQAASQGQTDPQPPQATLAPADTERVTPPPVEPDAPATLISPTPVSPSPDGTPTATSTRVPAGQPPPATPTTAATATSAPIAVATMTPTPTGTTLPSTTPTVAPTSTPAPSATPVPSPTPTPLPTATSTPTPTATPTYDPGVSNAVCPSGLRAPLEFASLRYVGPNTGWGRLGDLVNEQDGPYYYHAWEPGYPLSVTVEVALPVQVLATEIRVAQDPFTEVSGTIDVSTDNENFSLTLSGVDGWQVHVFDVATPLDRLLITRDQESENIMELLVCVSR